MNLNQIVEKFIENPDRMRKGAGYLSKVYKCTYDDILEARKLARAMKNNIQPSFNVNQFIKNLFSELKTAESEYYEEPKSTTVFKSGDKINTPGIHIVMGCVHVPFHNKSMQQGIISLIKDLGIKIKGFHLIGDILDMNSLSSHDLGKQPMEGITLGYEYREGNKYLDSFDKILPKNISKTYIYGNHEDRYKRFMSNTSNMKYSSTIPSPREVLELDNRGYLVLEDWKEDFFYLGNSLQLFHGEFYGMHPALQHMKRSNSSVMFAHSHRVSSYIENGLEGYNIGWGGDVTSPAFGYASRFTKQNWQNAFTIVTIDDYGDSHVQLITLKNNRFYYNGKSYGE